jgi:hypothetical protein
MSDSTKIRVELQYTINLGNYESLRIAIGVEDFVRPTENTSTATARVYKFVEDSLQEKVNEERLALKNRK